MIVEDPATFAVESNITQAYERLSFRALGFFVIHLGGKSYGKRSPDSAMLACSYGEVERRIARRGNHTAAIASEQGAEKIATAFRNALFAEHQQDSYFGISRADFRDLIRSKHLVWAPDGDAAFDDGSYMLQFDVGDRVRLIAFKSRGEGHDPATLVDVWLSADDFYFVLQRWHDAFETEWASTPKAPEIDCPTALLVTDKIMKDLHSTLSAALTTRYTANAARIHELAAPLTNTQFWQKPFPYGNSFGHLVLHLTGNLNYYIGAEIAHTGYIRDRPREFNDPNPPSKDEALKRFDDAVQMVIATVRAQSPDDDWSVEYSGTGTDARNPLEMVVQCAAHMQHHIGQMIYLGYEWNRKSVA